MTYFNAWYRKESEGPALDPNYPDWVVYALNEGEAREKVMDCIGQPEPDRGFRVFLMPIEDEDAGTIAFAKARQSGQGLL